MSGFSFSSSTPLFSTFSSSNPTSSFSFSEFSLHPSSNPTPSLFGTTPASSAAAPSFGFGSSNPPASSSFGFSPLFGTISSSTATATPLLGVPSSASAFATTSSVSATTTTKTSTSMTVSSTSGTTSTVSTTISPAPKLPFEINGKTVEIINEWNSELLERTGKFQKQANAIAERDKRILQNCDILVRLETEVAKVVETQANLEWQLELIETHQQEVDKGLQSVEEETERIYKHERNLLLNNEALSTQDAMYEQAEIIERELKQMAEQIKTIIQTLNANQGGELEREGFVNSVEHLARAESEERVEIKEEEHLDQAGKDIIDEDPPETASHNGHTATRGTTGSITFLGYTVASSQFPLLRVINEAHPETFERFTFVSMHVGGLLLGNVYTFLDTLLGTRVRDFSPNSYLGVQLSIQDFTRIGIDLSWLLPRIKDVSAAHKRIASRLKIEQVAKALLEARDRVQELEKEHALSIQEDLNIANAASSSLPLDPDDSILKDILDEVLS